MTYNANDYDAHADREVQDNGTVINGSNGLDTDGARFSRDKANAPVLIDTIPFSSFTASSSLFKTYSGKLNRNAKKRVFMIKNSLDQALSSLIFYILDSTVYVGGSLAGDSYSATSKPAEQRGIMALLQTKF